MKKLILSAMVLTSLFFTSCNNDDDNNMPAETSLTLDIQGLEDLGDDYVYEGWLMVDGSPVSSGRFTVNTSGALSQSSFEIPEEQLSVATAFILTIEPATNDDPAPSDVHILAGNFSGDQGTVSVAHPAALGNDFSMASGNYILATPTDGGSDDNEESGIWFLDNSSGSAVAGLDLPTLPAGWKYEGWLVIDGTPVSTGTFTQVDAADDNAATSPFKGDGGSGPAFPGEDLLQNAPTNLTFPTDLRGKTAVVSIEPYPDNSSHPFLLKPLAAMIPADADLHTAYGMNSNLSSFPTGSFSR